MRRLFLASIAALPLLAACAPTELRSPEARVVFFEANSTELDTPARAVVAEAAEIAKRYPSAVVDVLGFAADDRTSFPGGNRQLSEARARTVSTELRVNGVPQGRIRIAPLGAVAYEAAQVESRRVEIRIHN
ncbi:OmpA family protein [Roseomonas sp. BN140053]|uniref:OmpA family protein n=1 Tax=Roseomonas sp. BN140053 TaxID=3391898 RepID=UPI0039EAEAA5